MRRWAEALDELRAELSPWEEPGHVFLSPMGKRWDERNFARAFDRLRTKAHKAEKVRPLHFHCARHTFASWALEGGRLIKWVQERLGHSSAELTLRTYTHLMPSGDDELDFLEHPYRASQESVPFERFHRPVEGLLRKPRNSSASQHLNRKAACHEAERRGVGNDFW